MVNTPPILAELISFELSAIESGYKLLSMRPIFDHQATLTFKIKDLLENSNHCVANMRAHDRLFMLRVEERIALAPLLYLAGFKILDMVIEHILEIDPYSKKKVGFNSKIKQIKKLQPKSFGLGEEALSWLATFYEKDVNIRNPLIHKKIVQEGSLKSIESVIQFLEVIYWVANLESADPLKKARAKFETLQNVSASALTIQGEIAISKKFEIIQIENPSMLSYCRETIESKIKEKLSKMYPDTNFDFFILSDPR